VAGSLESDENFIRRARRPQCGQRNPYGKLDLSRVDHGRSRFRNGSREGRDDNGGQARRDGCNFIQRTQIVSKPGYGDADFLFGLAVGGRNEVWIGSGPAATRQGHVARPWIAFDQCPFDQ
jgi:hypothetical protein